MGTRFSGEERKKDSSMENLERRRDAGRTADESEPNGRLSFANALTWLYAKCTFFIASMASLYARLGYPRCSMYLAMVNSWEDVMMCDAASKTI